MDISVVGSSRHAMKPERATLRLEVACEADKQEPALRECTNTVNVIRQAIDQLAAGTPSPITWFAVLPIRTRAWRPWNKDGKQLPMRFSAEAQIKVKFCDFAALSRFANTYGSAQFVKLEGVEWALTEATKTQVEQQVLTEAVRDAFTSASQIAAAAGAGNVTALEIAQPGLLSGIHGGDSVAGGEFGAVMRGATRGSSPDGAALDLAPEDIELSAKVHARFTAS
jgi:uncharacterized protein